MNADEFIGLELGPYRIASKLGEGGMGAVFRAVHGSMQRDVALKILPRYMLREPQFLQRFYAEARSAGKVIHPNVVQVFDTQEQDGIHYIAMELVDGLDLRKILGEMSPLAQSEAVELALQAVRGLDAAHGHGIIHRDIKPANLMVSLDRTLKITDFGLSKNLEAKTELTQSGQIMGTPAYMSPEQADGQKVDFRTDMYSLGVCLFEMLVGDKPFKADTPVGYIKKHCMDPVPEPRELRTDLDEELCRAVGRMLEKDREDRFGSYGELMEGLEAVQGRVGSPLEPGASGSLERNGSAAAGCRSVFLLVEDTLPSAGALFGGEEEKGDGSGGELHRGEASAEPRPGRRRKAWLLLAPAFLAVSALLAYAVVSMVSPEGEGSGLQASGLVPETPSGTEPQGGSDAGSSQDDTMSEEEKRKADEEAYRKVREKVAGTWDRSVIARAWRTYLADHPRGRHAGKARKILESLYPLFVPGVDLDRNGERFFNARDRTELAFVPAGTFSMGYRDGYADERPVHEVKLGGYYIYRHEVTRERFARFLNDYGALTDEDNRPLLADDISSVLRRDAEGTWSCPDGESELPMVRVTWFGAQAYARWAEGSLPSEAQWEKAARGRANTLYPWGEEWRWDVLNSLSYWAKEDIRTYGWGSGMSEERRSQIYLSLRPLKAGLFPDGASDYGCLNMAGNVKEWCLDFHEKEYYAQLEGTAEDPVNLLETGYKTVRGGSYLSIAKDCRTTMRSRKEPGKTADDIGFRCVMQPAGMRGGGFPWKDEAVQGNASKSTAEDELFFTIQKVVNRARKVEYKLRLLQGYLDIYPKGKYAFEVRAHQERLRDTARNPLESLRELYREVVRDVRLDLPPGLRQAGGPGRYRNEKDGSVLVLVPGDRYTVGSLNGRESERPAHWVRLAPFFIGLCEVTNEKFARFLNERGSDRSDEGEVLVYDSASAKGGQWNWGVVRKDGRWEPAPGREQRPVTYVTWYGARAYARWAGGDLPSEAQWEAACRGGSHTDFPWGDRDSWDFCWYADNAQNRTHDAAGLKPNAFGIHDMSGNVAEWCLDYFQETFYSRPWASGRNPVNISFPGKKSSRVVRGGSLRSSIEECSSFRRSGAPPAEPQGTLGFRIVRNP